MFIGELKKNSCPQGYPVEKLQHFSPWSKKSELTLEILEYLQIVNKINFTIKDPMIQNMTRTKKRIEYLNILTIMTRQRVNVKFFKSNNLINSFKCLYFKATNFDKLKF